MFRRFVFIGLIITSFCMHASSPMKDIVKIGRNVTVARGVVASVNSVCRPGVDVAGLDILNTAIESGCIAATVAAPIVTALAIFEKNHEREEIYNKYSDELELRIKKDPSLAWKKRKLEGFYFQSTSGVLQASTLLAAVPMEFFSLVTQQPEIFVTTLAMHTVISGAGYYRAKRDLARLYKVRSQIEEKE